MLSEFLASELNLVQNPQSRKVPLLYTILGIMQQGPGKQQAPQGQTPSSKFVPPPPTSM